jgi:hypothetical protein
LHHLEGVEDSPVFNCQAIVAEADDVDQLNVNAPTGGSVRRLRQRPLARLDPVTTSVTTET